MAIPFKETENARFKRYDNASNRVLNWDSILEEAYLFTIPNRNDFTKFEKGQERNIEVFDSTAVVGVQNFANNIQSILMPPFKHWAIIQSGPEFDANERVARDKFLQKVTAIMFRWLDQSNFNQVINESLQDLAIGTGVIIINEGTDEKPLTFVSVPLSQISMEEGEDSALENFWRDFKIPARMIQSNWPMAKLPQKLQAMVNDAPDNEVELIEGVIRYPQNPPESQYYYYVQWKDTQQDLVSSFRDYSPFIGFRFSKSPGEIMGRGPVLQGLPFIRVLNKMAEFELRSASLNAFPMYLASNTGVLNPHNITLSPGAIIPVEPNFLSNPPIQPIPTGGDVRFLQLSVTELRQQVNSILFSNPLGPITAPNKTATEISIRQQEWIRRSGAAFGRLTVELLQPIIERVFRILQKKGLFIVDGNQVDIELDNKFTTVRYESPLIDLQAEDDVLRYERWAQLLTAQFGSQGLLGINIEKVPQWLAEKIRVDLELSKDQVDTSRAINSLVESLEQQKRAEEGVQPQEILSTQPLGVPNIPSIGV